MKTFLPRLIPIPFIPLLLAVIAGLLLCSCEAANESSAAATSASAAPQQASTPAAKATARYDCLTTPNGIPRKLIVKKRNVVAYEHQGLSGNREPLRFFRKYFIFEESATGYEVGDGTVRRSVIGWVSKEDVLPWDSEQAIFFTNKQAANRVPVRVWMSPGDTGNPKKPHFTEQLNRNETSEPFPILQKRGSKVQVAFLWKLPSGSHQALPPTGLSGGDGGGMVRGSGVERSPSPKEFSNGGNALETVQEPIKRMDNVFGTLELGPRVLDLTPQQIEAMRNDRIQTGWFEPDLERTAAVAVYVRRQELEAWSEQLHSDLLHYKQKEPDILVGILRRHAAGTKVTTIWEALRVAKDLPYLPDMLREENLSVDEKIKARALHKNLLNIEKLLLMEMLFNHYEAG